VIVILTPYDRSETAAAAVRLACLAHDEGLDVRLLSLGPEARGVHPYWDARVRPAAPTVRLTGCRLAVHFQLSRHLPALCRDAAGGRLLQVAVPRWHSLRRGDADLFHDYDRVACPSLACRELVRHIVDAPSRAGWLRHIPWTSGLPARARHGLVAGPEIRFLFWADAAAVDLCAAMTLYAIADVLERAGRALVTLAAQKCWPRGHRRELARLPAEFAGRFRHVSRPPADVLAALMECHDWLCLPGPRADFGLAALDARALGLPVVCYDVAPYNELLRDGVDAALVGCEVWRSPAGAEQAVPSLAKLAERCASVLSGAAPLGTMQAVWDAEARREHFRADWLECWREAGL
jgi:hypothetical protein